MTAFDGNSSLVNVYFDGDDDWINISLSDDPDDQDPDSYDAIQIRFHHIPEIVADLVGAYNIKTKTPWTEDTDTAFLTLFPVHHISQIRSST